MRVSETFGLILATAGSVLAGWQGTQVLREPDSTAHYQEVCAHATDNLGHPWLVWQRWWYSSADAYDELARWNGANWEVLGRLPQEVHPTFGVADGAFDPENKLWFVFAVHDDQNHCDIYSSHYDPATGQWASPLQVNDPDTTTLDEFQPRVSVGQRGGVWAVWFDERGESATCNIKAGRWDSVGQRWQPEMTVNPDTGGINRMEWFPDVAVDTCGVPHVVWTRATPSISGVLLYSRYQDGQWREPEQLTDPDSFIVGGPHGATSPRLVVDNENHLYCAFLGAWRGDSVVGLYWCRYDPRSGWSAPARIDTFKSPADPIWSKDIAVNRSDDIWVAYDRGGGSDWRIYAEHYDGLNWSGADRIDDGKTLEGGGPNLVLDAEGLPLVIWDAESTRTNSPYTIWYNRYTLAGSVETPNGEVRRAKVIASIVRGVLCRPAASSIKPQASSCLLDISGRRVLDLHPGANDVSRLAPGVYFIWQSTTCDRRPAKVSKVVIQR